MLVDDRPTIHERYGRALSSHHLQVKRDARGDIDTIIAAGWVQESLGTALIRTRHEYDAQRAQIARQAADSLTERVLVLASMRSLAGTRAALGRYAERQATLRRFMRPPQAVMAVTGRALDAWLDPHCHECSGRGFSGGAGTPMMLCSVCGGSGLRHPRLGRLDDEHEFGRWLLTEMDRKTERVARSMRRFLANSAD